MELKKDEKVILEDGVLGFRTKLFLTNRRLFVLQGEGLLKVKWEKREEISLQEISAAYAQVESLSAMNSLMLKLKNGGTKEYHLVLSNTQIRDSAISEDVGTDMAMKMKFVVDRWVTAINQLIK